MGSASVVSFGAGGCERCLGGDAGQRNAGQAYVIGQVLPMRQESPLRPTTRDLSCLGKGRSQAALRPSPAPSQPLPASSTYTGTVIALAAGDIACGAGSSGDCQQMATANILATVKPDIVLPLGDNQYECGSLVDFKKDYGPSWGRFLDRSHPALGNHEYETSGSAGDPCYQAPEGAPGYFEYYGKAASPNQPDCTVNCPGYYSYDVGTWHIIVLNSICGQVGGCGLGSPQETWLKSDLAAHPRLARLPTGTIRASRRA